MGRTKRCRLLLALATFAQVAPSLLHAQERPQLIYGRLLDDRTRGPIRDGAVHLVRADGVRAQTVITDSAGTFRLVPPAPGEYRLRAERIGYRTGQSDVFRVLLGDAIHFDFWLSTSAVLLAPIEIRATSRPWNDRYLPVGMVPFYERMQFYEKLGGGTFFTRAKIADFEGLPLTTLLTTIAGVQSTGNGGVVMRRAATQCPPRIFLNGSPFNLDGESLDQLFSLNDLEAVEVYRGASQIPAEFGGSAGQCGVIVLWTRRSG